MDPATPSGESVSQLAPFVGVATVPSTAPGDLKSEVGTNSKSPEGSESEDDAGRAEDAGDVKDAEHAESDGTTSNEDFQDEDENSEEDSNLLRQVSSINIGELPMPDVTEFSVPLPSELQEEESNNISNAGGLATETTRPMALPPQIVHIPDILKPMNLAGAMSGLENIQVAHVGLEAGLTGDMQATFLRLPPGTRTSRPVAQRLGDSVTYCISGRGLLWQNGWTFPFESTDCVGWKGGTGIAHTIINDSNRDGSSGEDLILITAHEIREGESFFHPLDPDIPDADASSEGNEWDTLWRAPPVQGDFGPHPGIPSVSSSGSTVQSLPEPQQGYRPSNVINAIAELDSIGEGELFANATSLSQETGLSGRLGCNFEVPPPGTRSSDPHAHSLEDELVYIVSGSGLVWINGHVQSVREGDAVGFPGGTGVAHNFINDSNADGAEGEPLILWIIGQNRRKEGDLVYYPLHVEEKSKLRRWWADPPKYELGPHNGRPQRPRK